MWHFMYPSLNQHFVRPCFQTNHADLRLESLEDRCTPAGKVSIGFDGINLVLTGDNAANSVLLRQGTEPGTITIQGIATTLNGSSEIQHYSNVKSIQARMNLGNDNLDVRGITIQSLYVEAGRGNDRIVVQDSTFQGNDPNVVIIGDLLENVVQGTSGNDTITLQAITIRPDETPFKTNLINIIGDDLTHCRVSGGNDQIKVIDTQIVFPGIQTHFSEEQTATITIWGDRLNGTRLTGGNDFIDVNGTKVTMRDNPSNYNSINTFAMTILGDSSVNESTTVGGNDIVNLTNSTIALSGSAQGKSSLSSSITLTGGEHSTSTIKGDNNIIRVDHLDIDLANSASTEANNVCSLKVNGQINQDRSNIEGGNDFLTLTNISFHIADTATTNTSENAGFLTIIGDMNLQSTIRGGNDAISLKNASIEVHGQQTQNTSNAIGNVYLAGDLNTASTVIGGNDVIVVMGSLVNTSGTADNRAILEIVGESEDANSSITGGRDVVTLLNLYWLATCAPSGICDTTINVFTDAETSRIVGGQDLVTIVNLQAPQAIVNLRTGAGDDRVSIQRSKMKTLQVELGIGNDQLVFTESEVDNATLLGQSGRDCLTIGRNKGQVTYSGFEIIKKVKG